MDKKLLLSALLCASLAHAAEPEPPLIKPDSGVIGINTFTHHTRKTFGAKWSLCNVNPGIYYVHPSGLTGGVFRNSECSTSAYAAYTIQTESKRFALTGGLATGYKYQGSHGVFQPFVAPSVAVPLDDQITLRLAWMIGIDGKRTANGTTIKTKAVQAFTLMLEQSF